MKNTALGLRGSLFRSLFVLAVGLAATSTWGQATKPPGSSSAGPSAASPKPDFPPFKKITEGYEKVVSTMDGKPSLYTIWVRKKDSQMLAALPKDYARQRHFIALTVASGERYAGLQAGELYVYWKRYNKRMALVAPNITTRSTGDPESKDSVKRLYTDRVILDVPIVTLSAQKAPVIDMDALLVGNGAKFFGASLNHNLSSIKTAKAFPENVELAFEAPAMGGGQMKTYHYSISRIPDSTGYKTRLADQRVGYFVTSYTDLGKYKDEDKRTRYINRWHLEKADTSLKLSPPKNPIVFYIEQTTPRRYRYWVKQGILYWNKAFERVGIRDAIEVRQQDNSDTKNPKHMDKDPEDVRYNFVRWLNNDIGTAIGPSRVHPLTGQILDADIILTDGWIRHFERQFHEVMPKLAVEGFSPRTLDWLTRHPGWDPRIVLAPPSDRQRILAEQTRCLAKRGGHPVANVDPTMLGDDEYDGLVGRVSQMNGLCLAAEGKSLDLAALRMSLELAAWEADAAEAVKEDENEDDKDEDKDDKEGEDKDDEDKDDEDKDDEDKDDEDKDDDEKDEDEKDEDEKKDEAKKDKDDDQRLDGIPERFIGPLMAELVTHEVGHTLGLRHNFKASSTYTLGEINSEDMKQRPHAASVMDYLPINMPEHDCKQHGNYTMIGLGPYDMWAIEYGYTFDKDLKPILDRVAEPELQYGTDEDTWGPDPLARRYDFSKNPLEYAKSQLKLAKYHRERLLDKFVTDGDSWDKARRGYELTLSMQLRSLSMMANWVGGAFVHRDKKGDKNARPPIEVVPVDAQREALQFTIENTFHDDVFGLTPELLKHLASDQWLDEGFGFTQVEWPVHDRIMSLQSSVLTMLMNPDTLQLVYDNELRTEEDQDALTLPELLDSISSAIWTELYNKPTEKATARKPWISSLRRNLQREHLDRLIDLTVSDSKFTAAYRPISNLAMMRLRHTLAKLNETLEQQGMLDSYSLAHIQEAKTRIEKALDAQYFYNADDLGGSSGMMFILGNEDEDK